MSTAHGNRPERGTWCGLCLSETGHTVITPVLTGLGSDQARLSPNVSLNHHIKDVAAVLSGLSEPVILVGHSYAGMIVSDVAEAAPTLIERLVFVDAFVPDDGQCALDLLPVEAANYFRNIAREHGDGWRLPGGESQLDLWGLKREQPRDFVRADCAISAYAASKNDSPSSQSKGASPSHFH